MAGSTDAAESSGREGKVALVTGGSRGIGRAIALRLAMDGCGVLAFTFHSDDESARISAEEIEAAGAQAIVIQAQLENPEDIESCFRTLEAELQVRIGNSRLDIVVNNAGNGGWDTLETSVPETFDQIFTVHGARRSSSPSLQPSCFETAGGSSTCRRDGRRTPHRSPRSIQWPRQRSMP